MSVSPNTKSFFRLWFVLTLVWAVWALWAGEVTTGSHLNRRIVSPVNDPLSFYGGVAFALVNALIGCYFGFIARTK